MSTATRKEAERIAVDYGHTDDLEDAIDRALQARDTRAIEILRECRAAYAEDLFTPLKQDETTAEGVDQMLVTRVSAQMARHTLDQMIEEIRAENEETTVPLSDWIIGLLCLIAAFLIVEFIDKVK